MAPAPRSLADVHSILIVDDDPSLLESLSEALSESRDIRCCSTLAQAKRGVVGWTPDIVLLDVILSDGEAHELLLEWDNLHVRPAVISFSGAATAAQAFRLAELGVRAYLPKPFSIAELRRAIDEALASPPDPGHVARRLVGHASLSDLEEDMRVALIDEAMARSGKNKRAAAKLLGTSRQMLQYFLRKRDER